MTFRVGVIAGLVVLVIAALGAARFHEVRDVIAGCRDVPGAGHGQYDAAVDLSMRANSAISSGNYSSANDLLDMAISKLGHAYETGLSMDDTGLILQAGQDKASHLDFKLAAQMKQSALQTRLSMFRKKAHVSDRCHALLRRVGLG
jgi:hypothetical protein